jgi:hypothetical protein
MKTGAAAALGTSTKSEKVRAKRPRIDEADPVSAA